jgi:hypothetical protein
MFRRLAVGLMVLILAGSSVVADYTLDTSLEGASASFWGEAQDDAAGTDVAGVGDVNGDGYADFLITAPGRDAGALDSGEVYLFLGQATGWSQDMWLSRADASFWGEQAGDAAGTSVAGVGDVNGDGLGDFLIGAPSNDEAGAGAGQVYLVLGRAQGWTGDVSLAQADASFLGENPGDGAGLDVSPAGDVNGDGLADFLISAPHYHGAAGKVYVILGRADASFVGENSGDLAGQSVAAAGDVNGDGLGDFLIGAWSHDGALNNTGKVYLILGKTAGWRTEVSLAQADASFHGETQDEMAGFPIAGAGDVNGDGLDDFLVGAVGFSDGMNIPEGAGKVYLIWGRANGWGVDQSLATVSAGSFVGEDFYDAAGWALAGGGDVNGDGFDDVLIGAPDNWEAGEGFGQVYLILGKASGWEQNVSLSRADASFWGERTGSRAGSSLAIVGDVDGDGFDDFIVGAEEDHESYDGAGQAYLLLSTYGTGMASQTQCFAAGDMPRSDFGSTDVQIDFSAGTEGCVTVIKHRERPAGLANSAAVWWEISTTKADFVAALTFYYANGEIAGLSENDLQVFWRPDAQSLWQPLAGQSLNTVYNKIVVGQVTTFGQYALAPGVPPSPTPPLTPTSVPPPTPTSTLTPTPPPASTPTATPPGTPPAQRVLSSGWQLISLPWVDPGTPVEAALSALTGQYEQAATYSACEKRWRRYSVVLPGYASTLSTLDRTQGVWVKLTNGVSLPLAGAEPTSTSIRICQGWNLIGYPSLYGRPVPEALSSIAGKYTLVYTYDGAEDRWLVYKTAAPEQSTLTMMMPGWGYWVYATQDGTLIITN